VASGSWTPDLQTGTAAGATAVAAPGSVRVVKGAETLRAWEPEHGWAKLFCSAIPDDGLTRYPERRS
jgi:hypothetical protein